MPSAVRPTNVARVSMLMQTDLLLNSIRTNQVDLLKVQNQLATGLRLARPSDSPAEATTIMHLDNLYERQQQYMNNLEYADDFLATTDTVLGQSIELTQESYTLALESIGMGTNDAGRAANAQIIDQIIKQLISIGNTTCRDSYIFAGQNGTQAPFEAAQGGVLFSGSTAEMQTRVSDDYLINFSIDGNDTFGARSQRVLGTVDLNPNITAATLLTDLNGAQNQGIRRGSIVINDGVNPSTTVDLTGCITVGDVIDKINDQTSVIAAVNAAGNGLQLSGGVDITVTELGTGNAARDLGIFNDTGAGALLTGQDVDARLTLATPITALAGGAGIDNTSGLLITNSLMASVGPIDFSSAQTLEDIITTINNAGIAAYAEINADKTGINIHNLLAGSQMSIGENAGTTAADLGIRSLTGATLLTQLNGSRGIHFEAGANALLITDGLGTGHAVNLDSAVTVQDVIDAINTATGGVVTAALASVGNGMELTDNSGGPGDLMVTTHPENLSGYFTAQELGLEDPDNPNTGSTLTGADVNRVMPDGLFSHLLALRDALLSNNDHTDTAISDAAAQIEEDRQGLSNMRGIVGAQMRSLEDRKTNIEDNLLSIETLRSDIRDIDFTEAITRYQNLYTALQGNLMTGSQLTNISLLDFLS